MRLPKRTHVSELSDSELMLLDFMFDSIVPRPLLEEGKFSTHHNTSYSHGFNTEDLNRILQRLVDQGVLFSAKNFHNYWKKEIESFGLTPTGGNLWESERKPVWERYVEDGQTPTEKEDVWKSNICSYSQETLKSCAKFYIKTGFLDVPISELEYTQSESQGSIYWKTQRTMYECQYLAREEEGGEILDWTEYERNRVWWRHISELQKYFA